MLASPISGEVSDVAELLTVMNFILSLIWSYVATVSDISVFTPPGGRPP